MSLFHQYVKVKADIHINLVQSGMSHTAASEYIHHLEIEPADQQVYVDHLEVEWTWDENGYKHDA